MPSYFACQPSTGKRKVAAQLLAGVDDPRRRRPAIAGLLQDRVAVLARLPEVDVHRMHRVTLVLQPTQNDRSIKSTRISKNARRHRSEDAEVRGQKSELASLAVVGARRLNHDTVHPLWFTHASRGQGVTHCRASLLRQLPNPHLPKQKIRRRIVPLNRNHPRPEPQPLARILRRRPRRRSNRSPGSRRPTPRNAAPRRSIVIVNHS